MTAKLLSSFAAGLIAAAVILGIVYFSGSSGETSAEIVNEPTAEVMKNRLDQSGYVVLTEQELEQQLEQQLTEAVNEYVTTQPAEGNEPPQETIIYRTVLNVASGMTSIDVGRTLVEGKIIEDARTFVKEVEKRGLSNKLRPGNYVFDSDMTLEEVIPIIFK